MYLCFGKINTCEVVWCNKCSQLPYWTPVTKLHSYLFLSRTCHNTLLLLCLQLWQWWVCFSHQAPSESLWLSNTPCTVCVFWKIQEHQSYCLSHRVKRFWNRKTRPPQWYTVCNTQNQSVILGHINKNDLCWIDTRTKYKLTINFLDWVSSCCYFYIMNHHFIKPTKRFVWLSTLVSLTEGKCNAWNTSCLSTEMTLHHEREKKRRLLLRQDQSASLHH